MPRHSMAELALMRIKGKQLLRNLADEAQVALADILGPCRAQHLGDVRVEFMKRAAAMDMGSVTISRMIKRHHTTVLYHLNDWRAEKYAAAKAREQVQYG